jgi:alpha-galactosidase
MTTKLLVSRFAAFSVLLSAVLLAIGLAKNGHASAPRSPDAASLAPTPPMGWNSWDAYGEAVPEADVRASAKFMAENLKSFGWQYITVDMGWYVTNHSAGVNAENAEFSLDEFGRFTPAVNTIPSAKDKAGFKPLGDYIHSLGLKFGIHILRGIPRQAVKENLPIAGSSFHAAEAADRTDTCPWNPFNYGLKASLPAAQAYYDSIARLYADWGVDLIKVDCISSHPYKGEDIRMLREALNKSGRPILLSLSPGPAPLEKAEEMSKYANMWRMSDDVWDVWQSDKPFPQGPRNQFERAAKWAAHSGDGHWPDADMLPIGSLRPTPGWGEPRDSRLSPDEQRTLVTLWCIARSPLVMGGSLVALKNDPSTLALLTNPEVLEVDQRSLNSHAVINTDSFVVWVSESASGKDYNLAIFNLDDEAKPFQLTPAQLGIPKGSYCFRDLWQRKNIVKKGADDFFSSSLGPHSSVLYGLTLQTDGTARGCN